MKVIGYFTSWDDKLNEDDINYKYLTHINYAFLIPKDDGSIVELDYNKINKLISYSRQYNVKVFISVGGWCYEDKKLDTTFEKICDKKESLDLFINNIIKVVHDCDFDGVDIDWEYPTEKYIEQYEYMLSVLKDKLKKDNKNLSIAIPPGVNVDNSITNISAITNKVLNTVDWINLMVYDNVIEKNHSSYEFANISLEYWLKKREYPKERIVLGLPFYTRPSNITYRKILNYDKGNYYNDIYNNEYYNGAETILRKIDLVKQKECSGVMIWALNYDTKDEYSLLKLIGDSIK